MGFKNAEKRVSLSTRCHMWQAGRRVARIGRDEDAKRNQYAQDDGEGRQPLFGGRVLGARVDLFPQRQVVVHARVVGHVERDAGHVVEDDI